MIKKLIITGILAFPLLALPWVTAQVYTYEDMPKKVQAQLDLNKLNGLPYWNDVLFSFHVSAMGIEPEERQILMNRATKISEIISVKFEKDNYVIVECEGGTNFDKVKFIFSSLVSKISGVENRASIKRTEKK